MYLIFIWFNQIYVFYFILFVYFVFQSAFLKRCVLSFPPPDSHDPSAAGGRRPDQRPDQCLAAAGAATRRAGPLGQGTGGRYTPLPFTACVVWAMTTVLLFLYCGLIFKGHLNYLFDFHGCFLSLPVQSGFWKMLLESFIYFFLKYVYSKEKWQSSLEDQVCGNVLYCLCFLQVVEWQQAEVHTTQTA